MDELNCKKKNAYLETYCSKHKLRANIFGVASADDFF